MEQDTEIREAVSEAVQSHSEGMAASEPQEPTTSASAAAPSHSGDDEIQKTQASSDPEVSNSGVTGNLEVVDADRIGGWAWNPSRPAHVVKVIIYFNRVAVAEIDAGGYRHDLEQSGIGDGHHAFEWFPTQAQLPSEGCEVSVAVAGTDELLGRAKIISSSAKAAAVPTAQSPTVRGAPSYIGAIDMAEVYRIAGWVFNRNRTTERVTVEICLNGTPLATVRCDEFRPDLKQAGYGDGRHAFNWSPEPSLLLPGNYTIEVRVLGLRVPIAPTVNMYYKPALLIDGAVKLGQDGMLEGWVWNKLRRNETVTVGLFEGDNLLSTGVADRFDQTLLSEGVGTGAHAFSIRLPSFYDGEPRVFTVKALPSSVELAGSPISVPPAVGRQVTLAPTMRNMEAEQTSRTLVEAITNFSRYPMPEGADVNVDKYRLSCLNALAFLYNTDKFTKNSPIIFPVFKDVKVSIIIPAYNQFDYTWRCLKSIAVATWGISFEVILMDDCSSDETPTLPDRVQGLRYIRQDRNKHFILNCNQGAKAAKGEYLYFLNNDTELTPNALRALLQTFSDFPDAGVVGSKLIYPDGSIQEVGCAIWENGDGHTFGRHERDALLPEYRYLRECHYVSGASLLIPRELFNQVGGFDERFVPAYSEDSDLCMSVHAAGYKVIVQPTSVVIHYERVSSAGSGDRASDRLMKANKPKFLRKWGRELARHPRANEQWDLIKDIGIKRRCLFFDWRTPRTDEDAGSYAALQEMRVLQSLGVKVTFASLDMDFAGRHTEMLQRVGVECVYKPYYKNWQTFLDQRGSEFDFVYGMRFDIMEQVIEGMRERMPQAKIIFNCADLHFLRNLREARLKRSLNDPKADEIFAKADGIKQRELSVMRRSDAIIVYNEVEREVVQTELPGSSAVVMPWIVPARPSIPSWSERKGIAFLGSYQHVPNRDGVEFFARQVMPQVRQAIPDCEFFVYGSDMESLRKSFQDVEDDGIKIVGSVGEVSEAFDRHRVFVAPLRYGAGIKGKVVMALCNGIPTVLTPVATEGMNVRNGHEVVLAETPAQFAEAVIALHENEAHWRTLSNEALEFGRSTFGVSRAHEVIRKIILDLGITI